MFKIDLRKNVKMKNIFIIMILLLMCLTACGENDSIYEYGTFSGSIESKFELVDGSSGGHPIVGADTAPVYINYAKTTDGGLVAWKDGNYCYTLEGKDSRSLCSNFAIHFNYVEPMSFE